MIDITTSTPIGTLWYWLLEREDVDHLILCTLSYSSVFDSASWIIIGIEKRNQRENEVW